MLEGKTVKSYERLSFMRGETLHLLTFDDGSRISFQGNMAENPFVDTHSMKAAPRFFPPEEVAVAARGDKAARLNSLAWKLRQYESVCEGLRRDIEKEVNHA
jgi:hypothetical protein